MSDLISREEAIGVLETMTEIEEGIEMMYALPSIEAEPVVHGEWEDVGDDPRDLVFRCTHCKVEYSWGVDMSQENHCPNCGAKMKAGGQNE